jgi:hypothetical protein
LINQGFIVFSQTFIESLPRDNIKAAAMMCEYFFEKDKSNSNLIMSRELYEQYTMSLHMFKAYCDPYTLDYSHPMLNGNADRDIALIRDFFLSVQTKIARQDSGTS